MTLCFAAFVKVLKECSKPKVYNKILCGAVVKTIDVSAGEMMEADDGKVSHLLSCEHNLSPEDIIKPAQNISTAKVCMGMTKYVFPLLDMNKLPLGIIALRSMVLSNLSEDNALVGQRTRKDIEAATGFDPADFLADIFLYTVLSIENKAGKDTIGLVTEDFVNGFESERGSFKIGSNEMIEMMELDCTLKDSDFEAVFHEMKIDDTLNLKNKSGLELYYLDISDSAFDYMALNEYLFDSVGMYVYSRTQMKDFVDRRKVRNMGAKALRLMQANGNPGQKGTGNELGEMLIFTLLEDGLHAPKLLSKVEINASAGQYKSKSDCVHLLKRKVNGEISYQLVFGASSINGTIEGAIDNAFDVIAEIKGGRTRERHMVDSTLFNNTYDAETTAKLKEILVPNKTRQAAPDMAFGVFVGYSIGVEEEDNDAFRTKCMDQMETDIKDSIPYIEEKIRNLDLGMHSYYFYFIPFNNADLDKEKIMNELLVGGER